MNSKYLIIQVDIDKERGVTTIPLIQSEKYFIPSVKAYCKKFNYDYLVVGKYMKKIWNF